MLITIHVIKDNDKRKKNIQIKKYQYGTRK